MREVEELALEVDELNDSIVMFRRERDEARDLARALWSALHEATDDLGAIARIDPDLDVDSRLPYWLTGVAGAPETWQRDTDGDGP